MSVKEAEELITQKGGKQNLTEEEGIAVMHAILNDPHAFRLTLVGALRTENYNLVLQLIQDDNLNKWYEKGLNQSVAHNQHLRQR
jgi:hypothetical protein